MQSGAWEYRECNEDVLSGISVYVGKLYYTFPNCVLLKKDYYSVSRPSVLVCLSPTS